MTPSFHKKKILKGFRNIQISYQDAHRKDRSKCRVDADYSFEIKSKVKEHLLFKSRV